MASSMTIYDAAMEYQERGVPLVMIGGKEYGSGSSRDWAAKGVNLLGVKAVIVESFERIHRSNLVGMGVLPLLSRTGRPARRWGWTAARPSTCGALAAGIAPGMDVACTIHRADGAARRSRCICRDRHRWTRSTTSATAASCTTCCASCLAAETPPAAPTEHVAEVVG